MSQPVRTEAPRVSKSRLYLIGKLAQMQGSPVRRVLKRMRLQRPFPFLINKYYSELAFQRRWAPVFQDNKPKVLEYWKRYRYFDEIVALAGLDDASVVLDVGCGVSTVLHFVPGQRYGIDPFAEEYRKFYAYTPELHIQKGFGEHIPFGDVFFDVVLSSNMLDHCTDPRMMVAEIHRVLKPGGYLVLTVEIFHSKVTRGLAHLHSLTRDEVPELLAGKFEVCFERTSPWIQLTSYVTGTNKVEGEQLITVLRRA